MGKVRILIAEDKSIPGMDLRKALLNLGYNVQAIASSCAEVIERADAMKPDLIIMDIVFSGKRDMVEALRHIHEKLDIPIIYYASHRDGLNFTWSEEAPYGYLAQPIDLSELDSAIESALNRYEVKNDFGGSEEKYHNMLESIEDGYYEVDLRGNLTLFNDSLCRIHGYARDELVGMNYRAYMDDDTVKHVFKTFNGVYQTGKPAKGTNWEIIRKDGSRKIIGASVSLRGDSFGSPVGFRGIIRDITEQKRAEQALRESEEKYRTIIESMEEGYFEVDLRGNFTFFNDSLCTTTGYSRTELMGMNNRQYMDEATAKNVYNIFNNVFLTGHTKDFFEWGIIIKNGSKRIHSGSVSLIKDSYGNPMGFRGIIRDVTEKKRMEEKLKELSLRDDLTGLYNRRGFLELTEQQWKIAKRMMRKMLLVYADIDRLKYINDTLGHYTGDRLIIEVADIIKKTFRTSDIIARIGGDEFVILVVEITDLNYSKYIDKLQKNLKEHNKKIDLPFELSLSVGLALYDPGYPLTIEELMKRADDRMYEQKKAKGS
jgi:diguanylate cyclase (GGDEF)-like protein/PAS domain S-box-containing protein